MNEYLQMVIREAPHATLFHSTEPKPAVIANKLDNNINISNKLKPIWTLGSRTPRILM